jgi:hypothetical protein
MNCHEACRYGMLKKAEKNVVEAEDDVVKSRGVHFGDALPQNVLITMLHVACHCYGILSRRSIEGSAVHLLERASGCWWLFLVKALLLAYERQQRPQPWFVQLFRP